MASTSPSGYEYAQGATNVNPFWEQSENPVDYIKSIELVDDLSGSTGGYIVRYTDQDGASHTLGTINGFYTDITATQSGSTVSIYGKKNGVEALIVSFDTSSGQGGGVTEEQVREIVVSYGYQTAEQVNAIVESYGYQTASDVNTAIQTAIGDALNANY